jgi:hypothetical protein
MIRKTVRFDQRDIDCIDRACKAEHMTFAEFVRKACDKAYYEARDRWVELETLKEIIEICEEENISVTEYLRGLIWNDIESREEKKYPSKS